MDGCVKGGINMRMSADGDRKALPVGADVRRQKAGGFAALYLAAAYLVAMPYFLVFVRYPAVTDPVEKVTMLVGNHDSLRAVYLLTYVVFGIVLAVLALALYARMKAGAPTLTLVGTVAGLVWAVVLVASGMIFNAGVAAVVDLHATNPAQAVTAWQSIEPVAQGLGGSGGELLGGLWVLLMSVAALRTGVLPKMLGWLGIVIGAMGVISVVPALSDVAYGFGLLQIVWFVWLGIVMLRPAPRTADAGWGTEALEPRKRSLASGSV
jgi:hypothetical protein